MSTFCNYHWNLPYPLHNGFWIQFAPLFVNSHCLRIIKGPWIWTHWHSSLFYSSWKEQECSFWLTRPHFTVKSKRRRFWNVVKGETFFVFFIILESSSVLTGCGLKVSAPFVLLLCGQTHTHTHTCKTARQSIQGARCSQCCEGEGDEEWPTTFDP